jgi:2-oxoglutarate ferredoxin oxidoreductase subunit beta
MVTDLLSVAITSSMPMRRNIDINMILLNNRIYGLTKGQYSPTSPRGFVSKSSPYGTVEDPFRPAELCFGARGHFFARAVATDAAGTYCGDTKSCTCP